MACEPNDLVREAACFFCLNGKQYDSVQTLLLCQIRDSIGSGSGGGVVTQGTVPWIVSGSVEVSNLPASYPVTQITSPWVVSGSVQSVQSGLWDVSVNNFPATQTVDGTVNVGNFPATQPVSGTVTANQGTSPWVVSGSVSVSNFPATQSVTQGTSPWVVSGTVTVTPSGTQNVNLTQIGSTVLSAAQNAESDARSASDVGGLNNARLHFFNGSTYDRARGTIANGLLVDVSRVQGTVAVTQSTSPWVVSGSVSVSNFPATQSVTQGTSPWIVGGSVTLSDALANPTTAVSVGSYLLLYDRTAATWERATTVGTGNLAIITRNSADSERNYFGALSDNISNNPGAGFFMADCYSRLAGFDGTDWDRIRTASGASLSTGLLAVGNYLYNGTDFDRMRTAQAMDAQSFPTGTGANALVLGSGFTAGWGALGDARNGTRELSSADYIFNGTTLDRTRSVQGAHGSAGTGVPAAALLFHDGSEYRRIIGTDTNGFRVDVTRVQGNVSVTQSTSPWVVSGTVAVTQSTSPWVISGTVDRSWTLSSSTDSVVAVGNVAHDASDSGNPLKVGGKATTGTPTPVQNGDRVDAWFNEYGQIVTSDYDVEVGLSIGSTGLRDRLMAQRYTVIADSLADGLAGFWTQTTANGGTTTSSGGEGLIQTSASATGSAQLTSTLINYYPGQVGWINSAVRFNDAGSAGNVRRIGVFTVSGTTPQDGFYYELNGTTLNAVVAKAGVATAVASGSWSRVAEAPFTLDINYHSFEIRYTANTVWFYVDNVLRHKVSGTSASITATLDFNITIQSINSSGATNRLIAVRNIGVGRFGEPSQPVDETGLSAVRAIGVGGGTPHDSVDSGNPLKIGGKASSTSPTAVANNDRTNAWLLPNGAIADSPAASTYSIGSSTFRNAALSNSATAVKASSGNVYWINVYNPNASLVYLHFYDVAAGSVTVGTTTPKMSIALPSTATGTVGYESVQTIPISFGTAITVAASTTAGGGTAPGTALVVNIGYL